MSILRTSLVSEYKDYNVSYIAGCDESGAGAIVGPLVAAAVILPNGFYNNELYTTKKLTASSRIRLSAIIKKEAVSWGIALVNHYEIDKIGMANAFQLAVCKAVSQLKKKPNLLLVSGRSFALYKEIPYKCIVQGDKIYAAIAASSIIAKVYRDSYIQTLDQDFPSYGWKKNKGYATPEHRQAMQIFGSTVYHRKNIVF